MNRPRVTAKWAQSIDGRLATASGDSKWITGVEARTVAHQLRAEHDAVLVGIGTVLADDPLLTVRLVRGRNPIRVLLDSEIRVPSHARILDASVGTLIFAADHHEERFTPHRYENAEVICVPAGSTGLALSAVLEELARRGVVSVLVEGGAKVITAFLRAGVVDELAVFLAPKLLGAGREAVESLGIDRVNQALTVQEASYERLGNDLLMRGALR